MIFGYLNKIDFGCDSREILWLKPKGVLVVGKNKRTVFLMDIMKIIGVVMVVAVLYG